MKQEIIKLPIGHQPLFECIFDHIFDHEGICLECGYECEHDDVEDCFCLICEKDLTEDMACRAYDFAKDID